MYREVFTKPALSLSICGKDAYFDVKVDVEYGRFSAMDRDPMCDAFNTYTEKTGKVYITVVPTDPFHNYFNDMASYSVRLGAELAREVIANIRDDDDDAMWFTKDRLCCAAKYGKAM